MAMQSLTRPLSSPLPIATWIVNVQQIAQRVPLEITILAAPKLEAGIPWKSDLLVTVWMSGERNLSEKNMVTYRMPYQSI